MQSEPLWRIFYEATLSHCTLSMLIMSVIGQNQEKGIDLTPAHIHDTINIPIRRVKGLDKLSCPCSFQERMEAVLGSQKFCFCPENQQKEMERLIARMPAAALVIYFAHSMAYGYILSPAIQ